MPDFYATNAIALLLASRAACVFTFKTPTFDIKRLMSVSLAAVPEMTKAICCPALSQACVVILFVTQSHCQCLIHTLRKVSQTYNAMLPADPGPAPRPALLAVLLARQAAVYTEMAAVSAAVSVAALTPPSPQFGDCGHGVRRDSERTWGCCAGENSCDVRCA
jgi:hypothetical protein